MYLLNKTINLNFNKMKKSILILAGIAFISAATFAQNDEKLVTKTGHISFFSHTVAEDITANNYAITSTMNKGTGEVVYSVPMQNFEFEKALMQKHYNSPKYLDTKAFPKSKFKGKITNMDAIDFTKDGTYNANIEGELTLHGVTKPIKEKGSITVKGAKIVVNAKLNISLADYGVAFEKGKPSTNVAKTVEATIKSEYGN